MKQQNLKGQNNQCAGCGKLFKSNAAFDKHRVGSFGTAENTSANRRCATMQEMVDSGMGTNNRGMWVSSLWQGPGFWGTGSELEGVETEEVEECATEVV